MNSLVRTLLLSARGTAVTQTAKRCISTTPKAHLFHQSDERLGYPTSPLPPFKERMKVGLEELKKEINLWCEEMKETWEGDPILAYRPGETDIFWRARASEDSLDKWVATCDADNNEGYSYINFTKNAQGNAVFSGNINLKVPKDGRVKRAGYCNIRTKTARKSFKRQTYLDWTPYNMLIMKVRGDGRTYLLNIGTKGFYDITWNDMYHYQLYTRGGPYWQIAKIPFSKFYFAARGRLQDIQEAVPLNKVSSFGISAQDRHGGTFSLEIDYIGLEYDPKHVEQCAYEHYRLETGIAAN